MANPVSDWGAPGNYKSNCPPVLVPHCVPSSARNTPDILYNRTPTQHRK